MDKKFETPTIEIIYFEIEVRLEDASDTFYDENLDMNGWV